LDRVIMTDAVDNAVVDELHAQFVAAADAYEEVRDDMRGFDEIIAAATKVRDTSLAWTQYIEAITAAAATGPCH
jgi:hypothetical protein